MIYLSPATGSHQRNGSIDILRLVAAAGIVWFHAAAPGQVISYSALSLFIVLIITLPLQHPWAGTRRSYVLHRADRLLRPWLIWSGIFAVLKIAQAITQMQPLRSEFEWSMLVLGTHIHLWFLPFGFVCSIAAFFAVSKVDRSSRPYFIWTTLLALLSVPASALALDAGLEESYVLWCYGLPSVLFGLAIYFADSRIDRLMYVSRSTLVGCFIAFLATNQSSNLISFAIGVNLAIAALSAQITSQPWMRLAAELSMPVYLCHPIFVSLFNKITNSEGGTSTAVASFLLSMAFG